MTKLFHIFVCFILLSSIYNPVLGQSQALKPQIDSLYHLSQTSGDTFYTDQLIRLTRNWLQQARVEQNSLNVAEAYLILARAEFKLGNETEALKLFKLHIVELNQHKLDSVNSLSARRINTYENEVKALMEIQDELESENQVLKERQHELYEANTYIYYGLIIIVVIIIMVSLYRRKKIKSALKQDIETTIPDEEDNDDDSSSIFSEEHWTEKQQFNDQLTSVLDTTEAINLDRIKLVKQSFLFYRPKLLSGGDAVWTNKQQDLTIIAILDAPGEGPDGALYANVVKKTLFQLVSKDQTTAPSLILTQLEARLKDMDLDQNDGELSIGICTLDHTHKHLDFAGANISCYVLLEDEFRRVDGDKYSLFSNERQMGYFSTERIAIQKGLQLLMATDGFANQLGGKAKAAFGLDALDKAILSMTGQKLEAQNEIFKKLLKNWSGPMPQTDDIIILSLKF